MYSLDDLDGPKYVSLNNGDEVHVKIQKVELRTNSNKPGRKDLRLETIVVADKGLGHEGSTLTTTLFDGKNMYDLLEGLVQTKENVLNLLNYNQGVANLVGRELVLTAGAPRIKGDKTYNNITGYQVIG